MLSTKRNLLAGNNVSEHDRFNEWNDLAETLVRSLPEDGPLQRARFIEEKREWREDDFEPPEQFKAVCERRA
jgi:hypothetical protein